MTDYWLSKLFYDLQNPELAQAYRQDPNAVLHAYPLASEVRRALEEQNVAALAPRVNAYLLRYYFGIIGMPDTQFLSAVRSVRG